MLYLDGSSILGARVLIARSLADAALRRWRGRLSSPEAQVLDATRAVSAIAFLTDNGRVRSFLEPSMQSIAFITSENISLSDPSSVFPNALIACCTKWRAKDIVANEFASDWMSSFSSESRMLFKPKSSSFIKLLSSFLRFNRVLPLDVEPRLGRGLRDRAAATSSANNRKTPARNAVASGGKRLASLVYSIINPEQNNPITTSYWL
mmetsp:Transcript_9618/g.21411  ORF Transcript_9618/g.21411 Transcript_9618/m.21411 type:complete len:207 (+) Transcript_9618:416-1036(+)